MGHHSNTTGHLERSAEDPVLRRAIAACLDRALQQAGTSSANAAKWLSVTQEEVDFWRRGITVPPLHAFTRIAATLKVDVHWLCAGQSQRAVTSAASPRAHLEAAFK
jgi:hypothetical protein